MKGIGKDTTWMWMKIDGSGLVPCISNVIAQPTPHFKQLCLSQRGSF